MRVRTPSRAAGDRRRKLLLGLAPRLVCEEAGSFIERARLAFKLED